MDRHRSLYKENSSLLSPAQHNRTNRELQNANRAKKRRQIFENCRNRDISPTPKKSATSKEQTDCIQSEDLVSLENKENNINVAENVKSKEVEGVDQQECNKSRIALVAAGKTNPKKATRQEIFLLKFIQWKESHKQKEQKRNEPKKRPFVSSCGAGGSTFSDAARAPTLTSKVKGKEVAAFVPKGHTTFKPPAGLKTPITKMTPAAKDVLANHRKSFYTVVPTPPRNKLGNATKDDNNLGLNKTPTISNLARAKSGITPATTVVKSIKISTKKKLATTTSTKSVKTAAVTNSSNKPTAVIAPNKNPLGRALTFPMIAKTTVTVPKKTTVTVPQKTTSNVVHKLNAIELAKKNAQQVASRINSATKFVRPQPPKVTTLKERKPVYHPTTKSNAPKVNATSVSTGAVGKAHQQQNKRAATVQATERPITQRNARLGTNFKAKKTQMTILNRHNAPSKITINGKTLLGGGGRTCTADTAFAIAETPTDLLNINPFEPFVTSTRVKSFSPGTSNAPNTSPVTVEKVNGKKESTAQENKRTHGASLIKRVLVLNDTKQKPQNIIQRQMTKFNFVRYSVGLSELDTSCEAEQSGFIIEGEEKTMHNGKSPDETVKLIELDAYPKDGDDQDDLTMIAESKIDHKLVELKTPSPVEGERPVNYISSFVSVSRGKVSARKEREKRDSIYLAGANESLIATASLTTPNKKEQAEAWQATVATPVSIEGRRTIEAVRYYRQQLSSEIERLHAICDQWEAYKQQNLSFLQKTGSEDMINVTIGQTKLLTSKKFQQFKGLIDRCENGARGTAAVYDGSEKTKLITAVDLEGFWNLLKIQVEDVEKRFENITRWKSNNWSDPDELDQTKQVKPKSKPNLCKVKKAKAPTKTVKASSGLKAMLRQKHAEMRKNKETASADIEMALVLTPTRQRQRRSHSGTPKIGTDADAEQRSSTPRRISVVVRDRKSLSAAATVISLPVDSAVVAAVAAQRRHSRLNSDSPKSFKACSNELRRSLSNMEKAFAGSNDILRSTLAANALKSHRRSGTPNFRELPTGKEVRQQPATKLRTPSPRPTTTPAVDIGRKSILKTPGTAKGKPKSVIFSEKLRVKKFKFTMEDDDESSFDEDQRMQTSTEEPHDDQRTYSLRTRKVVLRPSSEFEIPIRH